MEILAEPDCQDKYSSILPTVYITLLLLLLLVVLHFVSVRVEYTLY